MKRFLVVPALLSAFLLMFFFGCMPDDPESYCIIPTEGTGSDQSNSILVAPANKCEYKSPINKTFYDPMLISFHACQGNESNVCHYVCQKSLTVSGEQAQWLEFPEGTSHWKLIIENEFFKQPYPVIIKVTDGKWDFGPPCDGPDADNLDICKGRPLLLSPKDDPKRLASLCVTEDTSINTYSRAYILDHKNGNLLFRGPRPCVEKDGKWGFDYDNLMATFRNLYKRQIDEKGSFPDRFRFVVISLTDNDGEGPSLRAEYRFFGGPENESPPADTTQPPEGFVKLPSPKDTQAEVTGKFRWWYIRPDVNQEQGARTSKLVELIDWIGELMNDTDTENPYIIYFHCSAGADRTGEVAISYLLKYRDMCPENAFVYGTTIFADQGNDRSRQIPIPNYLNGAKWYCQRLHPDNPEGCDYSSMDKTSVPGSEKYPCYYPWSDGECGWNEGD